MNVKDIKVGPFSIHSSESIQFVRKLEPDPYVLQIMENGLKLPFISEPRSYYEDNNKSCKDNIAVAQKKVQQWVDIGAVSEIRERPHVCSPLSVASRTDYLTGETKMRPCLDLSRHINPLLETQKIKLEDLSVSEKLLEPNDYQTSWDLTNCYFHIVIVPEHRKYLGFALPDVHGKLRYYQFNVMIYGVSIAAFVVTSLTKPLLSHLHKRGIRATIFIDDGRIIASSSEEAWSHHKYAISTFEAAGWNIQKAKTSVSPSQKLYHQGLWCDSVSMKYSISEIKMKHIEETIDNILASPRWKLRNLAEAAGKCMAARRAIGSIIPIMMRSTFMILAANIDTANPKSYDHYVEPQPRVFSDLKFLRENLRSYDGQPIITNQIGFCLNKAIDIGDVERAKQELDTGESLWVSDSSTIKAVAYNVHNIGKEISIHEFSVSERELSSSARELLAVYNALRRLRSEIKEAKISTLYWVTDSQVLTVWLQKGTKIIYAQEKIVEIFKILHSVQARIVPIWSPRESKLISLADECSKFKDSDDWGIALQAVRVIEKIFMERFTCDLFANSTNNKVDKFFSKVAAPGSHGINCFMQDWSKDFCYACPPVNLIPDVIRYIERIQCRGVLVVPYWQRNPFWAIITKDGYHLKSIFTGFYDFYPKIVTGETLESSAFQHESRRRILAIKFDTVRNCESSLQDRCLLKKCGICS